MNKYLITILCCGTETDGDEYYNFPELIEAESKEEALENTIRKWESSITNLKFYQYLNMENIYRDLDIKSNNKIE